MKSSFDDSSSAPVFHVQNILAELTALPHVVLKHGRVDSPGFNWSVPGYCIPSLRYFCDNPIPPDSEYRFFGIYPSEQSAFTAARADHGVTAHGSAWMTFLADREAQP